MLNRERTAKLLGVLENITGTLRVDIEAGEFTAEDDLLRELKVIADFAAAISKES